ncbi:MAG TPA: tetratricopeptide repeat protein, partial [Xanthobacteraceae bacterium]
MQHAPRKSPFPPSVSGPFRRRLAPCAAIIAATLALAGCTTLNNPPAAEDDALKTPSQSNLTSLSEVIVKHPDDPQAYNMRGSVYGETGRNDLALVDFSQAISL